VISARASIGREAARVIGTAAAVAIARKLVMLMVREAEKCMVAWA